MEVPIRRVRLFLESSSTVAEYAAHGDRPVNRFNTVFQSFIGSPDLLATWRAARTW